MAAIRVFADGLQAGRSGKGGGGVRSYVVQVLALVLVAIAGAVELWHTGTLTAATPAALVSGRAGTTAPPPLRARFAETALVSFKGTIEPTFRAHCAECHLDGNGSGDLHLDTYQGLIQGGSLVPGPIIRAGDHTQSILWQITQPGGNWPGGNRMPLGGPYLTTSQIRIIANWIDQGARNN